jgi:hypothetical protein
MLSLSVPWPRFLSPRKSIVCLLCMHTHCHADSMADFHLLIIISSHWVLNFAFDRRLRFSWQIEVSITTHMTEFRMIHYRCDCDSNGSMYYRTATIGFRAFSYCRSLTSVNISVWVFCNYWLIVWVWPNLLWWPIPGGLHPSRTVPSKAVAWPRLSSLRKSFSCRSEYTYIHTYILAYCHAISIRFPLLIP